MRTLSFTFKFMSVTYKLSTKLYGVSKVTLQGKRKDSSNITFETVTKLYENCNADITKSIFTKINP